MLGEVNKAFNSAKNNEKEREFILESVLSDEELIGDGEDDMEDVVDADSIPDDVYKRVDAALDKLVDGVDDTEVEEMVDDDMSDINSENIDLVITEAVGEADKKFWYDDENIGHPDQNRADGVKQQPIFDPSKKLNENTLSGQQYKSVVDEAVEKVATSMANAISEAVSAGIKTGMAAINEAEAKATKISEKEASPDGHEIKEEPSGTKGDDKVEIGDNGEKATDVPEGEVTLGHCAESKEAMKAISDDDMGPATDATDKKVEGSGKELPDPIDEKEKGSDADVKESTVDNSGKELEDKEGGPNTCTDDDKQPAAENQTPEVEVAPENKDAATQLKESVEETEETEEIDESTMPVLFQFGDKVMSNQDPLFENAVDLEISYSDVLTEGYNFDQKDEVNATIKEAKARLKAAKKLAKSGQKEEAIKELDDLIKALEKFKKQFKEAQVEDQTVMNAVMGFFARAIKDICMMFVTMLPTLGFSAIVIEFKEIIDGVMIILNAIGKLVSGEQLSAADFNMYTKSLEDSITRMIQKIKKVKSKIKSSSGGSHLDENAEAVQKETVDESAASDDGEAPAQNEPEANVEENKEESQNEASAVLSEEADDSDESLPGISDELYENAAVISNYHMAETIEAPETEKLSEEALKAAYDEELAEYNEAASDVAPMSFEEYCTAINETKEPKEKDIYDTVKRYIDRDMKEIDAIERFEDMMKWFRSKSLLSGEGKKFCKADSIDKDFKLTRAHFSWLKGGPQFMKKYYTNSVKNSDNVITALNDAWKQKKDDDKERARQAAIATNGAVRVY